VFRVKIKTSFLRTHQILDSSNMAMNPRILKFMNNAQNLTQKSYVYGLDKQKLHFIIKKRFRALRNHDIHREKDVPMESLTDLSSQQSGGNQSAASPQKQRLIKHIMRLTLLKGILIGISLVFLMVELYKTFLIPRGGSLLVSPGINESLLPLALISFGTIFALQWRLQILCQQHPAFQRNTDGTFPLMLGILGINFIGMGCLILLIRWGNLPSNVMFPIIGIWFLSFLAVFLYLSSQGKQHKAQ